MHLFINYTRRKAVNSEDNPSSSQFISKMSLTLPPSGNSSTRMSSKTGTAWSSCGVPAWVRGLLTAPTVPPRAPVFFREMEPVILTPS